MLNKILTYLKEAESIALLPHISVDGDGVGSSLAMGLALKKLNKHVKIYLEEEAPFVYSFLPGKELVQIYRGEELRYDVTVALDTGDLDRLGRRVDIFNSGKMTVNIDHHHTNSEFAFLNYVHAASSAAGEIVYQIIKLLGVEMDPDISTCLYVAIATDTGGFRFSNTAEVTHLIAADLVKNGVNVSEVSSKIFDTMSYGKLRLMGEAIRKLELHENGKIALISITDDMIKSVGAQEEDCDGIVNLGRNIRGVEVAAMLREKGNGEIKINLRSNNYVDVSVIAGMYSGGGHKRAAGCTVRKELAVLKDMLLKDIRDIL